MRSIARITKARQNRIVVLIAPHISQVCGQLRSTGSCGQRFIVALLARPSGARFVNG
jgi:hypothetical protein